MKNENYITIQGWMVNELKLSGNELTVYALIYGFCQDDESKFTGSLKYICNWLSCSRPTASAALKKLVEKGYISKEEVDVSGVKFNHYKTLRVVKKLYRGSKETLLGGSKETLLGGSKETLPYNTNIDNTKNNNIDIPEKKFSGVFDENSFEKEHSCETYHLKTESKPQKKKKPAERKKNPDTETYNGIKTSFLAYYLKITGTSYYFEGKDGKKIKSLENKLKFALNEKGLDSSPQSVINSFNVLLEKLPDFYKSVGLSLSVIDSKYNNIVAEIKNKRAIMQRRSSILPHQNSFIEAPKQDEINYDDLTL